VTDSLLGLLKLCLLALLYLFFVRVLWAVWTEVRGPRTPAPSGATPAPKTKGRKRGEVGRLTITEPKPLRGAAYDLGTETTVGRGAGCAVSIPDDTYASTLHARVFQRDGATFVEDLGSTNGTYVNGQPVGGPVQLHKGDRLQVGSTVLEAG
jgi:pSer/pThr/pTyr-binding forkhead associated (FHA) protein